MRGVNRSSLVLLCGLLMWGGTGREAYARGGNSRGPGGMVPPMGREPSDPTPPPPPPPGTAAPRAPGPVMPRPSTPTPPPPPRQEHGPTTHCGPYPCFSDWPFWYAYRREFLEPRSKEAIDLAKDRAFVAKEVVPLLLPCIEDEKRHTMERSAALVALGKVADDEEHVRLLLRVANTDGVHVYVQESAVLALGLLRRSDKSLQFAAALLDEVRQELTDIMRGDKHPARARGFAAIAVAWLANQPTKQPATTGDTLLTFALESKHTHPGLLTAGLTAVGLLPAETVAKANLDHLRTFWKEGLTEPDARFRWQRPHAAIAIGRLGDASDVERLAGALDKPRRDHNHNLGRSALMGLGTLGERGDDAARRTIADRVLGLLEAPKSKANALRDPTTRNLAFMTLARIASAQARTSTDPLGLVPEVGTHLLTHADHRKPKRRNMYAVLGAALLAQATAGLEGSSFPTQAQKVFLAGAKAKRGNAPRERGAYLIALAPLAGEKQLKVLEQVLADRKASPELRAYCALALGRRDAAKPTWIGLLRDVANEGRSEALLAACINTLGLLGAESAAAGIVQRLKQARSHSVKGTCARALANLGSKAAVQALITLAQDDTLDPATRAMALAGLGRVGDSEATPASAQVTAYMNWRAMDDVLNEIAALL